MTSIFERYLPNDIMGDEKLETYLLMELTNRRQVREKVREIVTIPKNSYISIERCAELYGVASEAVRNELEIDKSMNEQQNVLIPRSSVLSLAVWLDSQVAVALRNGMPSGIHSIIKG